MVNKDLIPDVFEDSVTHIDGELFYHPAWGIQVPGRDVIGAMKSKEKAIERAKELAFLNDRMYYIVFAYKDGGVERRTSPLKVIYPADWILERR